MSSWYERISASDERRRATLRTHTETAIDPEDGAEITVNVLDEPIDEPQIPEPPDDNYDYALGRQYATHEDDETFYEHRSQHPAYHQPDELDGTYPREVPNSYNGPDDDPPPIATLDELHHAERIAAIAASVYSHQAREAERIGDTATCRTASNEADRYAAYADVLTWATDPRGSDRTNPLRVMLDRFSKAGE